MTLSSARSYFDQLAAMGNVPRLKDTVGTCEFDVAGAGTWSVEIDHGKVSVTEGRGKVEPLGRFRTDEASLLRAVRGDDDENVVTAILRGAISIEGDLNFMQKLRVILHPADRR